MNIIVKPEIMVKLMAFANATAPLEFSGFGFVTRKGADLEVYDFVILNVGSEVYTEISPKKLMDLMTRPDYACMKLWLHRHPINVWSGRDLATILTEPLGGLPEMVKWSASMVLTPKGWIGRVDNYVTHTTAVCPVLPSFAEVYETVAQLGGVHSRYDWDEQDDDQPKKNWTGELEALAAELEDLSNDLGLAQADLTEMLLAAQDEADQEELADMEEDDNYPEEWYRGRNGMRDAYLAMKAQAEQDKLVGGAKLLARR